MCKIIFSKYSNERARRFALRTDIVQDKDRREVRKKALYPEGQEHIRSIARWYQELNSRYRDTKIRLNRCALQGDGLLLEYLSGTTLEQILDGYLLEGNQTQLLDCLFEYLEEVKKGFDLDTFTPTPEFERTFGSVSLPENLQSGTVVDLDMVLSNVIVDQNWTLIDYEWTFPFPVPYHFVVYRILFYYLNYSSLRNCLQERNLYAMAGLTGEELEQYEKMERHFQDVYVVSETTEGNRHIPLRDLYDAISPGTVDLKKIRLQEHSEVDARMVQLYQAPDLDFAEEHSEKKLLHKEGVFLGEFALEENTRFVRLDPCSKYCVVSNLRMQWGSEIGRYRTNGIVREDGSIFFPMEDPQIIVERPGDVEGNFRAYFEVAYLQREEALDGLLCLYGKQRTQLVRMRDSLQQREAKIREMENTKVWKAYRKIKGKAK